MTRGDRSSGFRPDIEGLRGIAVLLVVAYHCGIPGFSQGFIGVDVFLVLSGYLITGLLVAEVEKTSRLSLLQFYARRARRLLPASALTLSATLLVGALILAPQELSFAGRAGRATAVYMSNMFFVSNAADYFAPQAVTSPLLHTWSLAVEEQFYLFWPLLIMLGLRFLKSRKALLGVLSGITVLSLAVCIWVTARDGVFAFYGLPTRVWEFGIAGLAVLIPARSLNLPSAAWRIIGWLGLATIAVSGHIISSATGFPGWIALIPVLATVAVLVVGAQQPQNGATALLGSAPLQFFGTLSYSWYLWHWPFLIFAAAMLPTISVPGKAIAALAALLVAAITHRFVENPIRFHPYLVKRPALTLSLAGLVTLASLGAASLSMRFAAELQTAPGMQNVAAAADDGYQISREQCVSTGNAPDVKSCVFGDKGSTTNVVLFGDSHATQWFVPLRRIAESHAWKLTTFVKDGCPATDVFIANCSNWRAEAFRRAAQLHPSIVILGNSSLYVKKARADGPDVDEWQKATKRTLEFLTGSGVRVLAIRDNPHFSIRIPTCLARAIRHAWYPGGSCEMSKSASLNPAIFEAEQAAASGLPNVHFLDLTDRLCQGDVCRVVEEGKIMYRDDNHFTGSFVQSLTPELEAALMPILQDSL